MPQIHHILMKHNCARLKECINLTKLWNEHRRLLYSGFQFLQGLNSDQQVCNHVENHKVLNSFIRKM